MKTFLRFLLYFIVGIFHAASLPCQTIRVTYIANDGFLVSAGGKNVLIDALVDNPWGYDNTPEDAFRAMLGLERPKR